MPLPACLLLGYIWACRIFTAPGKVYKRGWSKHRIGDKEHKSRLTGGLNIFIGTNKEKRYLKLPPNPPRKAHSANPEVFSAERVTKVSAEDHGQVQPAFLRVGTLPADSIRKSNFKKEGDSSVMKFMPLMLLMILLINFF